MQVSSIAQTGDAVDADTVAVGVFEGANGPDKAPAAVVELLDSGEARRSFKSLALTHADGKRWLLIGLGSRAEFTPERARVAASVVGARAREVSARALAWELPAGDGDAQSLAAIAAALVEGTILGDYRFESYKSKPSGDSTVGHATQAPRASDHRRRRRTRGHGRAGRDRRRGGQSRARPAEPTRQRPDADGTGRVRDSAGAGSRGTVGRGRGTRRNPQARHGRVRSGRAGLRPGAGADHAEI